MKKLAFLFFSALIAIAPASMAQSWGKALSGGIKAVQAVTITDAQMASMVKESVDWMDANNPVAAANDPYTIRLNKLVAGLKDADGIPLNFKVYKVVDVNAFACPDGSVRVFSALMDMMNDEELLGVIGHEIGHVLKHHSKKVYRTQLLASAGRDALAARGGTLGALSQSQLGDLSEGLINAKYSQKQENEADDAAYDFLKQHGKNPWAIAMAFEKMQAMEGSSSQSSYFQKMFSSHPDTAKRIKRMSDRAKKDGFTRP